MKKIFSIVILAILTIACSDDDGQIELQNTDVIGTWARTVAIGDGDKEYITTYEFRLSGTYTLKVFIWNTAENSLVGYVSEQTGNYLIRDNEMTLKAETMLGIAANEEASYVAYDELVELNVPEAVTVEYTTIIEEDKTSLKLVYPPCEPNESCLGSLTFIKVLEANL